MTVILNSSSPISVEGAKGGAQTQGIAVMTKVQLYGKSVAVVQDNQVRVDKVDTSALFVATPDGQMHRRVVTGEGIQYEPVISHSSYYPTGKGDKR